MTNSPEALRTTGWSIEKDLTELMNEKMSPYLDHLTPGRRAIRLSIFYHHTTEQERSLTARSISEKEQKLSVHRQPV